ncbi:MAG: aminopeptidase P family protein [Myxococcota bacterium]
MLDTSAFRRRREALLHRVGAPVLLVGLAERSRNLPMNKLPFRQDSSFLYFTGCDLPGAAALLAPTAGPGARFELFLPEPAEDDPLWHGSVPSLAELGERYGADAVFPSDALAERARPLHPRTIAVADDAQNALAADLSGLDLRYGAANGDDTLIDAIIALRRPKDEGEIAELREAARVTAQAFRAAMRGTRPGSTERGLWTLFEAVLRLGGCTTGYDTILTQSGEVLHNHDHSAELAAGRLLLLDGGGEVASGYGVDVTRTWPVSGRFEPRQRSAYEAVLAAQLAAIDRCRPGVRYREVHDAACAVLARFLADEGLVRCSAEEALERHAHALFFPHGVGHLLGLDVHDLENFGDRPSYPAGQGRPEPFGTRYLRLDLPLEAGWVVTVEPGFYVVPAILGDPALRERFRDVVDFDRAASWVGFGGIRIEDDVLVGPRGPDVLTEQIPKRVADLEDLVGTGPTAEALLWDR